MVRQYKLGRTNQVADALSRKTELAAFKCEAVAATSRVTSTLTHRIRDGLEKGPARFICTFFAKECKRIKDGKKITESTFFSSKT